MRISGPNAEGFMSEVQKVAATFSPTVDVKPGHVPLVATRKRIAVVAQCGGIGFAIKHRAKAIGVAISYCVSAGNESDLGAGEFLDYMVQDASTDVILLFIEGIRDVDKFLAAAKRAAEVGKPVIVTKVGRSGAGERAAASHTASMAGWSAAYDAVFAKYGFIVSNDLDEAVAIAAVLTTQSAAEGRPRRRAHRVRRRRHLGRGHRVDAGPAGAGTVGRHPGRDQATGCRPMARRGNPDRRHRAGRSQRRLAEEHRAVQHVRTKSTRSLVVLSLSSETRMPFKEDELKPVIAAQNKPIVFYSYTLPSDFARRRAGEIRRRGAVGADPCRRRDAAAGASMRNSSWRRAADAAAPAGARSLRASEVANTVRSRQQVAAARRRHRAAGRSAGRPSATRSMLRSRESAFRW